MIEKHLDIPTGDGDMNRFVAGGAEAAGTPHRIEWYPGAQHGFVFPKREGIYHQASAERHWERLFSLYRRTLGPAAMAVS